MITHNDCDALIKVVETVMESLDLRENEELLYLKRSLEDHQRGRHHSCWTPDRVRQSAERYDSIRDQFYNGKRKIGKLTDEQCYAILDAADYLESGESQEDYMDEHIKDLLDRSEG